MRIVFLFLAFVPTSTYGQGHANTLVFGYEGGSISAAYDEFGLNILSFSNGGLEIADNQQSDLYFYATNTSMSDADGNLLFYSNGIGVYNAAHQLMDNGGGLNPFDQYGFTIPQGALAVPAPGSTTRYYLFYTSDGYTQSLGTVCSGLYYALIDMSLNNGLGKVIERKKDLMIDTLEYGKLCVVRHANGRDWWLVTGEADKNSFYTFRIDPSGVHYQGQQAIGLPRSFGFGEACFSPDGSKYVMYEAYGSNLQYGHAVYTYDFDRCTGQFSNQGIIDFPTGNQFNGGIAISPNSRWLYLASTLYLYQYDLAAGSNIAATQELIAEYEPFTDPFPVKFHLGFLAPDNRIYFTTTSGSRFLHVIKKPDEEGTACNFVQHGVRVICFNFRSLPTFANYRLGPADGTVCDSLGINNDPVSWWRYETDTLNTLAVEFTDLSYHEPATWAWNFGDGQPGTSERHPTHTYAAPGTYQVCLTVGNAYGTNTHCKTLELSASAAENPELQRQITVGPNPFSGRLGVALGQPLASPVFYLFDATGRLLRQERLGMGLTAVEGVEELPAGLYFWSVVSGGVPVKNGKVVKQ